jgi:hypothetical protein
MYIYCHIISLQYKDIPYTSPLHRKGFSKNNHYKVHNSTFVER